MELHCILPNKYWIVKDSGKPIGSLRAATSENYDFYQSSSGITTQVNVEYIAEFFTHMDQIDDPEVNMSINGFITNSPAPCLIDIRHDNTIYKKSLNANQPYHVAGYFAIKYPSQWGILRSPRLATILNNECIGPFRKESDAKIAISNRRNSR